MSRPASGDARAAKHAAGGRRPASRGTGDGADGRSDSVDDGAGASADDDLGIASWLESSTVAPDETGPLLSPLSGGSAASGDDLGGPLWPGAEPDREAGHGSGSGSGRASKHSRPIAPPPDAASPPGRRSRSGPVETAAPEAGESAGAAPQPGRRSRTGRLDVPESGARTPDAATEAAPQPSHRSTSGWAAPTPQSGGRSGSSLSTAALEAGESAGTASPPGRRSRSGPVETAAPEAGGSASAAPRPGRRSRTGRIEVPESGGARTLDPATEAVPQRGRGSTSGRPDAGQRQGRRPTSGHARIDENDPLGAGAEPVPQPEQPAKPTGRAAAAATPDPDAHTAFWADFNPDEADEAASDKPSARSGSRSAGGRRAGSRRAAHDPSPATAATATTAKAPETAVYEPGPGFAAAFGPGAPEARHAPATPADDDLDDREADRSPRTDRTGRTARPTTRTAPRRTGGGPPPGQATGGALATCLVVAAVIGFAAGGWFGSRADDDGEPGDAPSSDPGTSAPGEPVPEEGLTLSADPVEVAPNDLIALAGSLAPVEGGIEVSLQHKVGDGEWQDYPASRPITLTTRDDGTFSGSVATDAPGPNLFRVVNVDDAEMVSNEIEVTVEG